MKSSQTTKSGSGGAINIVVGGINQPITLDITNPDNDVALPTMPIGRVRAHIALDTSSTNITTAAYVQLIAATGVYYNELEFFNATGSFIVVAFGAAASEVDQFYIAPDGLRRQAIAIPAGTRISLKAVQANITSGLLAMNAFA